MEFKTYRRSVLGELKNYDNNPNSTRECGLSSWSNSYSVKEKITKQPVIHYEGPKSPTHLTNLELLTKVASGITFDTDKGMSPEFGDENMNFNDDNSRELETSSKPRKEKSLSILCDKFLKLYPLKLKPDNYIEISLDQATQFIGTDRRRIYDILIVLECLQMASKVCKNHYQWHGTQHLEGTLSQLKWLAMKLRFFHNVEVTEDNISFNEDSEDLNVLDPLQINIQTQKVLSNSGASSKSSLLTGDIQEQKTEDDTDTDHKDSSLGIMCQKFLMLFLVKSKVITLDNAAKILLGSSGIIKDCHKVKTKVRRLYDIANVLSSLELIKKVNSACGGDLSNGSLGRTNKKPAFQYIGPNVEPKPLPDHALLTLNTTRHSLLGHPLHAAWVRKYSRKRKSTAACPLLPKQTLNDDNRVQLVSTESSVARAAATGFSSGETGSPREKFPRSHSENCLGGSPKRHGALRSDILHVAELELKRICFEEEQKKKEIMAPLPSKAAVPKSNWRHHHSDNCISVGSFSPNTSSPNSIKNLKDTSWKNSILKNNNIVVNADSGSVSLIKKSSALLPSQRNSIPRKDVSICVLNRSGSIGKTTKAQIVSLRESVPLVIHSVHKESRVRGITINPVPISVSNCVMGPAYIIRQHSSGTASNINPVSISLSRIDHVVSTKDILCAEGK